MFPNREKPGFFSKTIMESFKVENADFFHFVSHGKFLDKYLNKIVKQKIESFLFKAWPFCYKVTKCVTDLDQQSKNISLSQFWPLFKWESFIEAAGAVAKISLSLNRTTITKLSLSKSVIHTVCVTFVTWVCKNVPLRT